MEDKKMKNKNHALKRVLAFIMLVILAVPLGEMTGVNLALKSSAASAVKTGYCGAVYNSSSEKPVFNKNAKFALYGDGTLVISGTGEFGGFKPSNLDLYYIPYANYEYVGTIYDENTDEPYDDYADITVKSVIINDGITSIGNYAFCDFAELESVSIPDSVKKIGECAFSECERITEIIVPDGVTSIGDAAFSNCKRLMSVRLPKRLNKINSATFFNCSSLFAPSIPDSVTSIGDGAFYNCTSLGHVTIPGNVRKIGRLAFYGNYFITVTIPVSVTSIQEEAFLDCRYLENVYYMGTSQQWQKIGINKNGNDALFKAKVNYNHKHDYSSSVVSRATCCVDGEMLYSCICGDHYMKSIPAKNIKLIVTKATTEKDGSIAKYCNECKKVRGKEIIPKIASVALSAAKYTYNGKAFTPTVTVKDSKGKVLVKNTDYKVTYAAGRTNPGRYAVTVTFMNNYSGSVTRYFDILPGVTGQITASQTTNAIKLTWTAVPKATGYRVYLYNTKTKKYATVTTTTKNTVTLTKLKPGTDYIYAVKAYSTVGGKVYWSAGYKTIATATRPNTPTLKAVAGSKKATLSWTKQTGADGYVIYMATSANGKFTKIANVKSNVVSFTKTGLTTGKTYYFKVAAYSVAGGKVIYSSWSSAKSAKIK